MLKSRVKIKYRPAIRLGWALLAATVLVAGKVDAQNTNAVAPTPPVVAPTNHNFFYRFDQANRNQMGQPAYEAPATNAPTTNGPAVEVTRRGLPIPFDSPPYPTGEWQIGATPIIGDKNELPVYSLMEALYGGPFGESLKKSRVMIYGWEDVSGNLSSSHNTSTPSANFPAAYDSRPNRLEQNQAVLYIERTPDEYQTDHMDWGFRVAGVYGLDYRYMISRGFLSDQLLKKAPGVIGQPAGNLGNYYGYDLPMMYADWYVPGVAEGMNIRVGRIISLADIEAQLSPNNLMSSHSLLYTYDPFTQWGIFSSIKLNDQWLVQAGISAGNDVAPWQDDPGRQPTGTLMIQWQSKDGKDSFYGGANAFNNADFGYNNIQQYVGTWTHKFTDKIWTAQEAWYMYQNHAQTAPTASVPYQNGAFPVKPGFAPEWSTVNYTMFRLAPATFLTVRNEVFDDITGSRTGFASVYSEHAIGITWWPDKVFTVRPELRFDHSYAATAYDNGTRHNQFTASFDVIYHF